ncbi:MAG: hypothetical protein J1F36_01870 [Clostridiales bacterium]|nr:hypothetical protein [Clostridiales bacterium]
MGQNEIFKLLLIILLLISNNDDCDNSCRSLTGNLNQIIIIMLLLGFIPTNDNNTTDTDTTF